MRRGEWFRMFPDNYTWSSAVIATISASQWGGSEIGEIHTVANSLEDRVGDNGAWFDAWYKMGEHVAGLGDEAEKAGHHETAAAHFMRAANYIQTGERLVKPTTSKTLDAYTRSIQLFKRGLPHLPFLRVEPVEVPFEAGKSLPGYLITSKLMTRDDKPPVVVFFDGLDVTKEMQYFKGAVELVKRGVACLVVDGPGNGESIRFRGMPLRYDYEVAGSAAVDYLETRDDVDGERIGVMAVSLGGYYASRCAAFEKRFKACVAWGAIYDYHEVWQRRIEASFATDMSVAGDHISWVLGVGSIEEALNALRKFTLAGVAGRIECPFLCLHGEDDTQIPLSDAQKLVDEVAAVDKRLRVFSVDEGGHQHCQNDNLTLAVTAYSDWFADRLGSDS